MPCKHHKDALIEAAASGLDPRGELRVHLDACVSCRTAFEQEQSLFASIDAGLCATANAELSASLLPRVRTRLNEESAPRQIWVSNWLVLTSAVMVVALFVARAVWRHNLEQNPPLTSTQTNSPGSVIPPSTNFVPPFVPRPSKESVSASRSVTPRYPVSPVRLAVRSAMPEVLVPRDQEILLVSYAEQWRRRKRGPLLAEDSGPGDLVPLQVAPIQIAQLDVKLLVEDNSQ